MVYKSNFKLKFGNLCAIVTLKTERWKSKTVAWVSE